MVKKINTGAKIMSYAEGKAKAINKAMEWQQSFSNGKSYYWSEMADFSAHFSKLAKLSD